jgi:hypothetical protein
VTAGRATAGAGESRGKDARCGRAGAGQGSTPRRGEGTAPGGVEAGRHATAVRHGRANAGKREGVTPGQGRRRRGGGEEGEGSPRARVDGERRFGSGARETRASGRKERERVWGRGGDDGWGPRGRVAVAANCRARGAGGAAGPPRQVGPHAGGGPRPPSRPKKERGREIAAAGPQGEEGEGEGKKRFSLFYLFPYNLPLSAFFMETKQILTRKRCVVRHDATTKENISRVYLHLLSS